MKERFEGETGHPNRIAALLEQRVVEHHLEIAEALDAKGKLVEFSEGDTVIEQGGSDSSAYFILSGRMRIFVNHRAVAERGPRECVGEMVTLDPAAPRSGTVKASEATVTLSVAGGELGRVHTTETIRW